MLRWNWKQDEKFCELLRNTNLQPLSHFLYITIPCAPSIEGV